MGPLLRLASGLALVALALGAGCRTPAPEPAVVRHEAWTREPATDLETAQRIRDTARAARARGPMARVGLGKISFPADASEYEAMKGYGLFMVTAICRRQDDLPLARVFVRIATGEYDLPQLMTRRSEVPASEAEVVAAFGSHRSDSLHLLPLFLVRQPGEIVITWGDAPESLVLAALPLAGPDPGYGFRPPLSGAPSAEVLRALIKREMPLFAGSAP